MSEKYKTVPVAWATRLYNTAYHAGHYDTVVGYYTHVYPQDMDSYHEDVVQEWLADNPQPTEQQPAPGTALVEPVAFCEDAALSIAERTFSTEVGEQLASDIIQYAQRLHSLYTAPKPAECTLNSDREQVAEVEAPSNSLPSWSECNLRVGNSEWLKDNDREAECDSLTANPLHEFIYEYDDSDAYKSAWFLHRLENLIDFIRSEQRPSPSVEGLVDALCRCRHQASYSIGEIEALEIQLGRVRDIANEALAAYRKQGGDT